ncbi:hypothetical protein COO60DRAFT_410566 [Scenedesmus sp. NREL 46B-D3]|nr:hypothetical protein COO60DRAFT_410566 [Scenedesmus sp. NREL 46B-D3]
MARWLPAVRSALFSCIHLLLLLLLLQATGFLNMYMGCFALLCRDVTAHSAAGTCHVMCQLTQCASAKIWCEMSWLMRGCTSPCSEVNRWGCYKFLFLLQLNCSCISFQPCNCTLATIAARRVGASVRLVEGLGWQLQRTQ